MKIQLTSYLSETPDKERLNLTADIINQSTADLILFAGHAIVSAKDIDRLNSLISNKYVEAIIELQDLNSDFISNCLYHIKNGTIRNLYTNQLFSTSAHINNNNQLAERFIYELETKRMLKIKGKVCLVIQCGELNILKNQQMYDNKVIFRIDDLQLLNRFNNLIAKTNIILNPIHSPMGNQGKMHRRREYLSENNRHYFSTSNTNEDSIDLTRKGLQYAYNNGGKIIDTEILYYKNSVSRFYDIE